MVQEIEPKTIDENWIDWEAHVFGFGYGTGEPHTILALKTFLAACPETGAYDYEVLERECGPAVAWLLINRLCGHGVDMIEYGTSPRFGWLTARGRALKNYMDHNSTQRLVDLVCSRGPDDAPCYPDVCNHGPEGHVAGRKCPNPFWT